MQLGTRWPVGGEPPARLPVEVTATIREVENSFDAGSSSRRWTLTWLEGRPIVELDPADGSDEVITLRFDPVERTVRIDMIDVDDDGMQEETP